MGSLAFALPSKPGSEELGKKFVDDLIGTRSSAHHETSKAHGLTRIKIFRQTTPHDMIVVYLEGPNVGKSMAARAQGGGEFDVWFGEMVEKITGHHPTTHGNEPPAELLVDWHPEHGHSRDGHAD